MMIRPTAPTTPMRRVLQLLHVAAASTLCALASTAPGYAQAPAFPTAAITVYAPSAAGSASDVQARVLARAMSGVLRQPVTVIDMPGGSGSVAEVQLQSRHADGYTLLFEPASLLTYTVAKKMVPYALKDFAAIAGVGGDAVCLAVRTGDARFPTLQAFVAYAHAHPDTVTVGGFGTAGEFAETYKDFAATGKIQARYIPYNGGGQLMVALLGAHVDAVVTAPSNVISDNKLRILAIASPETFPPLPSTPTFVSFGYHVVHPVQRGFIAKAGTPAAAVQVLEKAIEAATKDPQWQNLAKRKVVDTHYTDHQAWQAYLAESYKDEIHTLESAKK